MSTKYRDCLEILRKKVRDNLDAGMGEHHSGSDTLKWVEQELEWAISRPSEYKVPGSSLKDRK